MWDIIGILFVLMVGVGIILSSIKIIRPVELGLVERLGKYRYTAEQGIHFVIPIIDRMIKVNITENMVDIERQTVITKDKLNTAVDAVVYYKIKDVKKAVYNVDHYSEQLVSLSKTTLRAVIGNMSLADANENRKKINNEIEAILSHETETYGVDVLRVELQRIDPPDDVQNSMNNVVKAEQEKIAAMDLATAAETRADGVRRAAIKAAEGEKRSVILAAEAEAESILKVAEAEAGKIKLENEAIQKYFKGEAQTYKALETFAVSFQNGTKFVIDSKSNLVNVMSDMTGTKIIPIEKNTKKGTGSSKRDA